MTNPTNAGAPTVQPPTATTTTSSDSSALGVSARNAWANVAGVGWKKIFNGRDGAFQALVSLLSQARQTNRTVNLREEADGMIYEVYLW
jgi:hypothetical protein